MENVNPNKTKHKLLGVILIVLGAVGIIGSIIAFVSGVISAVDNMDMPGVGVILPFIFIPISFALLVTGIILLSKSKINGFINNIGKEGTKVFDGMAHGIKNFADGVKGVKETECQYCGLVFTSKDSKCPNCGAVNQK